MKQLKVFTDFHHASLLQSLILLFEGRFNGSIYRPIGLDWANLAYWAIYDHPATRAQYLTLDQGYRPEDGTPPLNLFSVGVPNPEPGIYYCQDIDSGYYNKAITVSEFMKQEFDIVIASVPQHIAPFRKLVEAHPNKPKLIYQIGNAWNIPDDGSIKNVMASALISGVPNGINFVSYHQEFDLDIFYPEEIVEMPAKNIYSFVNVFQHFSDYQEFLMVEGRTRDYAFRSFGGQCRDGAAHGSKQLAQFMRDSMFIWHTKAGGDGFGHILFNSAAVGKPLIVKKSYYNGKLAEKLMIDGFTCINIDNLTPGEIIEKIRYFSEPSRYKTLCQNVYKNFKATVDFASDAEKVKTFLDNLI